MRWLLRSFAADFPRFERKKGRSFSSGLACVRHRLSLAKIHWRYQITLSLSLFLSFSLFLSLSLSLFYTHTNTHTLSHTHTVGLWVTDNVCCDTHTHTHARVRAHTHTHLIAHKDTSTKSNNYGLTFREVLLLEKSIFPSKIPTLPVPSPLPAFNCHSQTHIDFTRCLWADFWEFFPMQNFIFFFFFNQKISLYQWPRQCLPSTADHEHTYIVWTNNQANFWGIYGISMEPIFETFCQNKSQLHRWPQQYMSATIVHEHISVLFDNHGADSQNICGISNELIFETFCKNKFQLHHWPHHSTCLRLSFTNIHPL